MKINGFVLAGGESARMGRDKALLEWNGTTLLQHMTSLLSATADQVYVIGREPLPDCVPGCGPLGGILTALELSETDGNVVVAVDLPLLTVEFLNYFRSKLETTNHDILACKIGSQFPLCLGVRRRTAANLRRRIEDADLSVHGYIDDCKPELIHENELCLAGFDPSLFGNINTEADYHASRKR